MQSNYKEVMDTISSLSGQSFSTYERSSILKAENDIDNLNIQVETMQHLLQNLNEQYEASKTELEAQIEVEKSQMASLREDISTMDKKTDILIAYMDVISGEEFSINKLNKDCDEYCKHIWVELKQLSQQGQDIQERVGRLKELAKLAQPTEL